MPIWKWRKIFHTLKVLFTLYNQLLSCHQKAINDRTEHSLEQCKKGDTGLKGSFVDTAASLTLSSSFLKLEQAWTKIRLNFKTRLTYFFPWVHHLLFLSISVLRSHWFLKLDIFLSFLRLFQLQRNIDKTAGNTSDYFRWIQRYLKLCSILTEFACLVTMKK